MSLDRDRIGAALTRQGPFARVVVAAVKGSAPRGPGTDMFVWDDGIDGTIGGGALEWHAMAVARAVLADGRARVERLPLGPAMNQCCGGAVTLVIERIDTVPPADWVRQVEGDADMPRLAPFGLKQGWMREGPARRAEALHIWGAGHVGRALVVTLHPLPGFDLTWHDIAADRFPADSPCAPTVTPAPATGLATCDPMATHLIVTHSHDIDLALCHAALTHGFGFCGLIGSATKWARFRRRLSDLGHSADAVDRITCPIGNPALGKHPQAIAVGVAAALLSRHLPGEAAEGTGS